MKRPVFLQSYVKVNTRNQQAGIDALECFRLQEVSIFQGIGYESFDFLHDLIFVTAIEIDE